MKKGLGIVKCGYCGSTVPVVWLGHKYKVPRPTCRGMMSIHRQRLKKFEAFKKQ